jgi:NAD(P)-dependent dehydrogenase (short-subunit alcohol dehydrogenase family)
MGAVMAAAAEAFGGVDILIANAGIAVGRPLEDIDDEHWRETIDIDLAGVFYSIRAAVPYMRRRGFGRIIATSSGTGLMGLPHLGVHFMAAKWAVIGLVKSVAIETAADGITANVICPATVSTPMVHNKETYRLLRPDLADPTLDDVRSSLGAANPAGRPWLEVNDVTRAVMYLVTDSATSGAVIDLGLTRTTAAVLEYNAATL